MCFYPKESLPGYTALFKHANDELGYCYYLIPCGKEDGQCGDVKVRCPVVKPSQRVLKAPQQVCGYHYPHALPVSPLRILILP